VGGRDSSVGIETRYGLDGPGIESRWCGGTARFSAPVQTGPGAHPASCTLLGVKRPVRDVNHPPTFSAEVKYTPLWAFMGSSRANFTFTSCLLRHTSLSTASPIDSSLIPSCLRFSTFSCTRKSLMRPNRMHLVCIHYKCVHSDTMSNQIHAAHVRLQTLHRTASEHDAFVNNALSTPGAMFNLLLCFTHTRDVKCFVRVLYVFSLDDGPERAETCTRK
jgi:hypothetical protein